MHAHACSLAPSYKDSQRCQLCVGGEGGFKDRDGRCCSAACVVVELARGDRILPELAAGNSHCTGCLR